MTERIKKGKGMIQKSLIEYCSPTLAGIKTGSLFSIKKNRKELNEEVCRLNKKVVKKGIRIIPIEKSQDSTLIYIYRPEMLKEDLQQPEASRLLKEKGYPQNNCDVCLNNLIKHLKNDVDFPHEIGLFLGYPPSDVKCFMNNPCDGVKCTGCWKVYGNCEEAKKIFEQYKKCKEAYSKAFDRGIDFEELVVKTG